MQSRLTRKWASKKDKKQYGTDKENQAPSVGATYIINISGTQETKSLVLEGESRRVEQDETLTLDLSFLNAAMPPELSKISSQIDAIKLPKPKLASLPPAVAEPSKPERLAEQDRWNY